MELQMRHDMAPVRKMNHGHFGFGFCGLFITMIDGFRISPRSDSGIRIEATVPLAFVIAVVMVGSRKP